MCLTRPFPFRLARLVPVSAEARSFLSRRSAEKATRVGRSRLAESLRASRTAWPLWSEHGALIAAMRRWTAIEIMLRYCSSGDHVAKSRVEVPALSRSLRSSYLICGARAPLRRLLFPGRDEAAVFFLGIADRLALSVAH